MLVYPPVKRQQPDQLYAFPGLTCPPYGTSSLPRAGRHQESDRLPKIGHTKKEGKKITDARMLGLEGILQSN